MQIFLALVKKLPVMQIHMGGVFFIPLVMENINREVNLIP